ncbi:hypothetical protein EBZ39_04925 [bacterium]|nr:hypothetical protein [bacterium]
MKPGWIYPGVLNMPAFLLLFSRHISTHVPPVQADVDVFQTLGDHAVDPVVVPLEPFLALSGVPGLSAVPPRPLPISHVNSRKKNATT